VAVCERSGHDDDDHDHHADARRFHGLRQLESELFGHITHTISSTCWCAGALRRSTLYITGTKNNVVTVASPRPPITARPSGAFCSPPSPSPIAIGTMPM